MSTLRDLHAAIDARVMVVEKGAPLHDQQAVYFEGGCYAWITSSFSAPKGYADGELGGTRIYDDFEDLLADMGEEANDDKWQVGTPPLQEPDFPEGWPEELIKADRAQREAWRKQIIAQEMNG